MATRNSLADLGRIWDEGFQTDASAMSVPDFAGLKPQQAAPFEGDIVDTALAGLTRGWHQARADVHGTLHQITGNPLEAIRADQASEEAMATPVPFNSYHDVGVTDIPAYAVQKLSEQGTNIASMLVPGTAAYRTARILGAAAKAAGWAGRTAGGLSSAGLQYGEMANEARESGHDLPGYAIPAAAAMGAADVLGLEGLGRGLLLAAKESVVNASSKAALATGLARTAATGVGVGAAVELPVELAQEATAIGVRGSYDPDYLKHPEVAQERLRSTFWDTLASMGGMGAASGTAGGVASAANNKYLAGNPTAVTRRAERALSKGEQAGVQESLANRRWTDADLQAHDDKDRIEAAAQAYDVDPAEVFSVAKQRGLTNLSDIDDTTRDALYDKLARHLVGARLDAHEDAAGIRQAAAANKVDPTTLFHHLRQADLHELPGLGDTATITVGNAPQANTPKSRQAIYDKAAEAVAKGNPTDLWTHLNRPDYAVKAQQMQHRQNVLHQATRQYHESSYYDPLFQHMEQGGATVTPAQRASMEAHYRAPLPGHTYPFVHFLSEQFDRGVRQMALDKARGVIQFHHADGRVTEIGVPTDPATLSMVRKDVDTGNAYLNWRAAEQNQQAPAGQGQTPDASKYDALFQHREQSGILPKIDPLQRTALEAYYDAKVPGMEGATHADGLDQAYANGVRQYSIHTRRAADGRTEVVSRAHKEDGTTRDYTWPPGTDERVVRQHVYAGNTYLNWKAAQLATEVSQQPPEGDTHGEEASKESTSLPTDETRQEGQVLEGEPAADAAGTPAPMLTGNPETDALVGMRHSPYLDLFDAAGKRYGISTDEMARERLHENPALPPLDSNDAVPLIKAGVIINTAVREMREAKDAQMAGTPQPKASFGKVQGLGYETNEDNQDQPADHNPDDEHDPALGDTASNDQLSVRGTSGDGTFTIDHDVEQLTNESTIMRAVRVMFPWLKMEKHSHYHVFRFSGQPPVDESVHPQDVALARLLDRMDTGNLANLTNKIIEAMIWGKTRTSEAYAIILMHPDLRIEKDGPNKGKPLEIRFSRSGLERIGATVLGRPRGTTAQGRYDDLLTGLVELQEQFGLQVHPIEYQRNSLSLLERNELTAAVGKRLNMVLGLLGKVHLTDGQTVESWFKTAVGNLLKPSSSVQDPTVIQQARENVKTAARILTGLYHRQHDATFPQWVKWRFGERPVETADSHPGERPSSMLNPYLPVTKIISGGQSGADYGGLLAGEWLHLGDHYIRDRDKNGNRLPETEHLSQPGITGGTAPKGYLTENHPGSPSPERLKELGLKESPSDKYPPRTEQNIKDSDGTVIFAAAKDEPGTRLTIKLCKQHGKPYLIIDPVTADIEQNAATIRAFLLSNNIKTLNVAGNRESVAERKAISGMPEGLAVRVRDTLVEALKKNEDWEASDPGASPLENKLYQQLLAFWRTHFDAIMDEGGAGATRNKKIYRQAFDRAVEQLVDLTVNRFTTNSSPNNVFSDQGVTDAELGAKGYAGRGPAKARLSKLVRQVVSRIPVPDAPQETQNQREGTDVRPAELLPETWEYWRDQYAPGHEAIEPGALGELKTPEDKAAWMELTAPNRETSWVISQLVATAREINAREKEREAIARAARKPVETSRTNRQRAAAQELRQRVEDRLRSLYRIEQGEDGKFYIRTPSPAPEISRERSAQIISAVADQVRRDFKGDVSDAGNPRAFQLQSREKDRGEGLRNYYENIGPDDAEADPVLSNAADEHDRTFEEDAASRTYEQTNDIRAAEREARTNTPTAAPITQTKLLDYMARLLAHRNSAKLSKPMGSVLAGLKTPAVATRFVSRAMDMIGLKTPVRLLTASDLDDHIQALEDVLRNAQKLLVQSPDRKPLPASDAKSNRFLQGYINALSQELEELRTAKEAVGPNGKSAARVVYNTTYPDPAHRVPVVVIRDGLTQAYPSAWKVALAHELGHVVQAATFHALTDEQRAALVEDMVRMDPNAATSLEAQREAFANLFMQWYFQQENARRTAAAQKRAQQEDARGWAASLSSVFRTLMDKLNALYRHISGDVGAFQATYPTFNAFMSAVTGAPVLRGAVPRDPDSTVGVYAPNMAPEIRNLVLAMSQNLSGIMPTHGLPLAVWGDRGKFEPITGSNDMTLDELQRWVNQHSTSAAGHVGQYLTQKAAPHPRAQKALAKATAKATEWWEITRAAHKILFKADGAYLRELGTRANIPALVNLADMYANEKGKAMGDLQLVHVPVGTVNGQTAYASTRPLRTIIPNHIHKLFANYNKAKMDVMDDAAIRDYMTPGTPEYDMLMTHLIDHSTPVIPGQTPRQMINHPLFQALRKTRGYFTRIRTQMRAFGEPVGNVTDYFPLMYDLQLLQDNREDVINKIEAIFAARPSLPTRKYMDQDKPFRDARDAAEWEYDRLINNDPNLSPFLSEDEAIKMGYSEPLRGTSFRFSRSRPFTKQEMETHGMKQYLSRDLNYIMDSYGRQASRRITWRQACGIPMVQLQDTALSWPWWKQRALDAGLNPEAVFGPEPTQPGQQRGYFAHPLAALEIELHLAQRDGRLTKAELEDVKDHYIPSLLGTLNVGANPVWRKLVDRVIGYETILVMGWSAFTSFGDPATAMWRAESWDRVVKGCRDLMDPLTRKQTIALMHDIGIMSNDMTRYTIANQDWLDRPTAYWTEKFFTANGMHHLSILTRMMATRFGQSYIREYADQALNGATQEERDRGTKRLAELNPLLDPQAALQGDFERDEDLQFALMEYVNQSYVAGQQGYTPWIMNDYRFRLFTHLKGFSYKFHNVVLKLMWERMREQPDLLHAAVPMVTLLAPALVLTLAGMTAKDLLRRKIFNKMFGKLKKSPEEPTVTEQLMHAVKMTGVPGVYVSLMGDALEGPKYGEPALMALAGPTASHVYRWMTRTADEWIPASIPLVASFPHTRAGVRSVLHDQLGFGEREKKPSTATKRYAWRSSDS